MMKKSVIAVVAGLVTAAAFASKDNVLVSFSTPGIDTYSDGVTVVEDGECYALIWTKNGTTFAGINADGTLVDADNSKIVAVAPIAKAGKCPPVTFQVDKDYADANYSGGYWGVYLLDTRKFKTDADGVILPDVDKVGELDANGVPTRVNGYGEVAALSGSQVTGGAATSVSVATTSASPASAAGLKVSDIKFVGNNVHIYVTGSLSCLAYELQSGDKPNELVAPTDGKAQYGAGDGEMLIITPKKPGAQFFKVNRK